MANFRIIVLIIIFCIISLASISILFNLQILNSSKGNIYTNSGQEDKFIRNTIFFQDRDNKLYPAATTIKQYNLFISPREIDDLKETYSHVKVLFDIDFKLFEKLASKKDDAYEVLKKNITTAEKNKIKEYLSIYDVPGVYFEQVKQRFYSYNSIGSHVLGFVGFNNFGNYRGQYGLEKVYNSFLSNPKTNTLKSKIVQNALLNSLIGDEEEVYTEGGDIVTTIDPFVQEHLEKQLRNILNVWSGKSVGGIIIEPHTGKIIAIDSLPSFNPNRFNRVNDYSVFINPLISNVYEVGSIFKPLTLAIGFDSGSIKEDDTYNDKGRILLNNRYISNYDGKARGEKTTIQEFINQSLNLGAVHILEKTGIDIFRGYLKSFTFESFTNIDLPAETGGLTSNLDSPRKIEYATAAYGHGIAVTPIGIVRALSSIANGGILKSPYIVDHINTGEGVIESPFRDKNEFRIFDSETTKKVTDILVNGFDEALLGGTLKDKSYTIASKTGTASIPDLEKGGYYDDKLLHTFFGYFPASRPEYLIFLFVEEPQWPNINTDEILYSSATLSHPFKAIVDYLAAYYEVIPDRIPTE